MARFRAFTIIGILLSLCLLTLPAQADIPPTLHLNEPGDYQIGLYSQWLEDSRADMTANAALADDHWQNSDVQSLNFGFTDSAYWLKTRIKSSSLSDWSVWISYSLLDYVDLYLCPAGTTDTGLCLHRQGGDELPFHQGRDVEHPNLIFNTEIVPGQEYLLLMRVQTSGTQQIPVSLVDANTLQRELLTHNIIRGGYYATMLVMGLYNLFIFFITRERSYFYYSAVTLTFLMLHMSYEGSAFQFFWPDLPLLNHYALPLSFSVNLILLSLFVPDFLQLKKYSRGAYQLFKVFTALSVMSLIMLPLLPYQKIVPLNNILSTVLLISALLVSIRFWIKGHAAARFFTIAWVALITGLILANARSLGLIPTNMFTLYAYQLGSFMEIILLSLALGERIVRLQNEQLEARKAMLKSQEDAIQYLRDYEDLYQNSLTGKFQLDDEGYFIKSNPAWRTMLGYGEQAHFTSDNPQFRNLLTNPGDFRPLSRAIDKDGRIQGYIVQMTQPHSGEKLVVSLAIRKRTHGENAAWIGSGQDITEQYKKEQALTGLQNEKAQALRQLVMGIAHEMNTPLGNIRMAESFLSEQHEEWNPEEINTHLNEGLGHIHEGIERLNALNQLMKNAIVQENQYQEENLCLRQWLSQWQTDMLALHPDLHLQSAIHSYITEWKTYPEALTIILTQLLDNSCRHNAEQLEKGELNILVEFRERGKQLELHYQDNGKGIDAEQRDVIFMPFYTTQRMSAENKGLGLYQTYNLLTELLHGQIEWPDNATGFYLCIRFLLPEKEVDEITDSDIDDSEAEIVTAD